MVNWLSDTTIFTSRLCALTVIHNYLLRRSDGTTAAQRFFGACPADLFTTLCARIPPPTRPRKPKRFPASDQAQAA